MLTHFLRAIPKKLAFRASATSSGETITIPATVKEADLIVLYDHAVNTTGFPTAVTPTGFTNILNETSGTLRRVICSYKIAASGDASSSITGMNGADINNKIMLVFSSSIGSVSVFDITYQATDAAPTTQTINSADGTSPLVCIAFVRNGNTTAGNFTMTPTDGTVTLGTGGNRGGYKIYNIAPANVTVSSVDGGTNNVLMSFYIQVS